MERCDRTEYKAKYRKLGGTQYSLLLQISLCVHLSSKIKMLLSSRNMEENSYMRVLLTHPLQRKWKKTFVNHISDKGLIPRIHKELL